MNAYDQIKWMMEDAERARKPLQDLERLWGRSYQQVAEEMHAQEQRINSAIATISNSYTGAMDSMQFAVDRMRQLSESPSMGHLESARKIIESIMSREESFARSSVVFSPQWQEAIMAYHSLGDERAAKEQALASHVASMAETSLLIQQRLQRVDWDFLGSVTPIAPSEFIGARDRFVTLAERYQSLAMSYGEQESPITSFPPIVSSGPPLEIATSAKVLDYLSRRIVDEEDEKQVCQTEYEYEDGIEHDTRKLLEDFDPELMTAWLGAKEALRSGNPDRGRHVSVALREIVTRVLHKLTPDSDVRSWSKDPYHFHKGRPTREARLLFICRGVNHGPFLKFVGADVRASMEFIDLFHRGTHALSAPFSDEQLRALFVRADSLLRFLLLTNQTTH